MQYTTVFDVARDHSDWWTFPLVGALMAAVGVAMIVYFSRHPQALYASKFMIGQKDGGLADDNDMRNSPLLRGNTRKAKEKQARAATIKFLFLGLWTFGTAGFTLFALAMGLQTERSGRDALKSGNYEVVEGVVRNFKPEPPEGHSAETFDVDDHHYSLSHYMSTGGYHETKSHGGAIHEGVLVRIADADGVIMRLEVADGPVALTNPTEIAAVRDTLFKMGIEDQDGRKDMAQAIVNKDTTFLMKMMSSDSARSRWLRRHVARAGWPKRSVVGDSAASVAWLILQHTPYLEFQREMLPKLKEIATQKEVSAQEVALLEDRVLKNENQPQEYGTQFDMKDGKLVALPIRDLPQVDTRRAAIGLPPMKTYVRMLGEMYKVPVVWPPE